jgi:hypothetical protein
MRPGAQEYLTVVGACAVCRIIRKKKEKKRREKEERRAREAREKERSTAQHKEERKVVPTAVNRDTLRNVRVIQRNLAYVINLPPHIASEDVSTFALMAHAALVARLAGVGNGLQPWLWMLG